MEHQTPSVFPGNFRKRKVLGTLCFPFCFPENCRSLFRYVFNDVEQCLTTALFTARADGRSESLPPLDFCKACLWQVTDASSDLRDPNPN